MQQAQSGATSSECIYYIIGNKCDLDEDDEREVSYEEGEQWVEDYKEEFCDDDNVIDITFLEVSAKEGTNINHLFDEIATKLLTRHGKLPGAGKGKKVVNDPA